MIAGNSAPEAVELGDGQDISELKPVTRPWMKQDACRVEPCLTDIRKDP